MYQDVIDSVCNVCPIGGIVDWSVYYLIQVEAEKLVRTIIWECHCVWGRDQNLNRLSRKYRSNCDLGW